MKYVLAIIAGYLVGSINCAYIIGKLNHVDIRDQGSGNAGASNTMITFGWAAGIFTALFDIAKALIIVLIFKHYYPDDLAVAILAGSCAVIGHIFPFYMQFKGGKGFASYMGMVIALNWKFAICLIIACVLITLISNYIVFATFTTITVTPVYFYLTHLITPGVLMLLGVSLLMLYRHKINIIRLINHEEIGLRGSKKHRINEAS